MLKKFLVAFVFSFLILTPQLVGAQEADFVDPVVNEEKIVSFEVEAKIQQDASVDISEKIQYDFGVAQKHGIIRNIPYKYKSSIGNHNLRLSSFFVTDENGVKLKYSKSTEGVDVIIKIGDANKTVSGIHVYVINYKVKNAINFFEKDDEFYWNATGNEWEVNMDRASTSVFLPGQIDSEKIKFACYAGPAGSNNECENKKIGNPVYFSQNNLASWNGLTIAVSFPKGIVREPTVWQKRLSFLLGNSVVILPFLVLAILLYVWKKRGKDPSGQGVIITQFDSPDNLSPLEVGLIIDERGDNKDISAEIINLAVQGYIKISAVEEEGLIKKRKPSFEFTQLKPSKDLKNDFDKTIMTALFGNDQESIKPEKVALVGIQYTSKTFDEIRRVDGLVSGGLIRKGYFKSNPSFVRGMYVFAGIMVIFIGLFLTNLFLSPALASLSFFISGLIIIIFARWMPSRTQKGVLAKEYILGLKNYLQVAEADRIKFHNAPEKTPESFEKLLPYAMVLGVEKEWAKQFETIYTTSPQWYEGAKSNRFSALVLASSFGDFRSSLNSTVSASKALASSKSYTSSASFGGRGSGGGGFSGGGFGGGGGKSW
jgi:uncharacterized membrane protein